VAVEELQELRYPFLSFIQFVKDGYWLHREAAHLMAGLVFLAAFSVYLLRSRAALIEKLVVFFFAAAIFNNPAYTVAGLRFNEIAGGLAAALLVAAIAWRRRSVPTSPIGYALCLAGALIAVHALVVAIGFPDVNQPAERTVLRVAVIGKIFVLGIVAFAFDRYFREERRVRWLVSCVVACGSVASLIYLFQAGVFLSGTLPYGTYWDAGFTGVPSFGSVSIERGHFGKFLVPLFPFFLLHALWGRSVIPLLLLVSVSLVNFSASNLAFLAGYLGLAVLFFRRRIARPRTLVPAGLAAGAIVALGWRFREQYDGVVEKIVALGLRGGDEGGRSFALLQQFVAEYPMGISYGGSTLRELPWMPQLNMGFYVFLAQLSLLAPVLLMGYVLLHKAVLRHGWRRIDGNARRALLVGIAMAPLVFLVDVLWFVPMLWAPLILFRRLATLEALGPGAMTEPTLVPTGRGLR
jgi:hypothetical protein